jgi:hypothetical protein
MSKLVWFKHYNTSSQDELIGNLIAQKNYEAVALYWVIVESISRFEDAENRGKARLSLARLSREINMKPTKTERVIGEICAVSPAFLICDMTEKTEGYVTFLLPKWLELQENRGGKREAKKEQNPGEERRENKEVRIERDRTPSSSVKSFDDRFKNNEWTRLFKSLGLNDSRLDQELGNIVQVFETTTSLTNFLESVAKSEKCRNMNSFELQRYLRGAVLGKTKELCK